MAVKPLRRAAQRQKSSLAGTKAPSSSTRDPLFSSTKKDKRIIKHSLFLNRIRKPAQPSKKRRRPSKKLVATLESLAEALPEAESLPGAEATVGQARIRLQTLKTKPGAMKRKQKIEKLERERFEKNMAQMAQGFVEGHQGENCVNRVESRAIKWATLRQFIDQTMEKNEAFVRK